MKVARSPRFLQSVANHPRVRPAVTMAGQRSVDLRPAWHRCVGLEFDTGGWLFFQHAMGYYEVHTLFLPKSRGVREKARSALHYMFTATDCMEVVTRVPADLPHALALAKSGGFTERFRRTGAWPRDSGPVDVSYLGLTLDEWVRGNDELIAIGEDFHQRIGEHKNHDDDRAHDAYVGFGIACWRAGQPEKGLWAYNRWAVFAGYRTLEMTNDAIEFDGVTLRLRDGEITVEYKSCQ